MEPRRKPGMPDGSIFRAKSMLLPPRLARPSDIKRIADVHVRARRAAYRGLIPEEVLAREDVDARERQWLHRLSTPQGRCWLLDAESGLRGFAYTAPASDPDLGPWIVRLYAVYLLEEWTGSGLGRHLMTHALDDLAVRGFTEVVLWYAEENERAGRFYRAAGFEVDPRVARAPFKDTGLHQRRLRYGLGVMPE